MENQIMEKPTMMSKVEKQILDNEILELHNKIAEHRVIIVQAHREQQEANKRVRQAEKIGWELSETLQTKLNELENFYKVKSHAIEEALNAG